jgi:hypothetical protein
MWHLTIEIDTIVDFVDSGRWRLVVADNRSPVEKPTNRIALVGLVVTMLVVLLGLLSDYLGDFRFCGYAVKSQVFNVSRDNSVVEYITACGFMSDATKRLALASSILSRNYPEYLTPFMTPFATTLAEEPIEVRWTGIKSLTVRIPLHTKFYQKQEQVDGVAIRYQEY